MYLYSHIAQCPIQSEMNILLRGLGLGPLPKWTTDESKKRHVFHYINIFFLSHYMLYLGLTLSYIYDYKYWFAFMRESHN
jgi:hypothetical protein